MPPTRKSRLVISLLFGVLCCTSTAWATSETQSKLPRATKSPQTRKGWSPETYDLSWASLPPSYLGTNAEKTHEKLDLSHHETKRLEFETSDEFDRRKAVEDGAVPLPFKRDDFYAFKVEVGSYKYDADSQVYRFITSDMDSCTMPRKSGGWLLCPVKTVYTKRGSYSASNSFGARTDVLKKSEIIFGLSLSAESIAKFPEMFSTISSTGRSTYIASFSLPIERAKALASKKLGVLLVGKLVGAESLSVMSLASEPTMSNPYDITVMTMGPKFDLKRIVIYVVETGEILKQDGSDM